MFTILVLRYVLCFAFDVMILVKLHLMIPRNANRILILRTAEYWSTSALQISLGVSCYTASSSSSPFSSLLQLYHSHGLHLRRSTYRFCVRHRLRYRRSRARFQGLRAYRYSYRIDVVLSGVGKHRSRRETEMLIPRLLAHWFIDDHLCLLPMVGRK